MQWRALGVGAGNQVRAELAQVAGHRVGLQHVAVQRVVRPGAQALVDQAAVGLGAQGAGHEPFLPVRGADGA